MNLSPGQAQQLNEEMKLGLSYVLSFKGVAQDLELSDTQNEKLMGLWLEVKMKLEREIQDYQANFSPRFSPAERGEMETALKTRIEEIRQLELDRITDVLLPDQLKRLRQIRFQILKRDSDGMQTFIKELDLTPVQIAKIKQAKTTLQETIKELRGYAGQEQLTRNEITEEILLIRKKAETDLLEILSADQRKKLNDLEGEPFEVQTGKPKATDR
jgi:hypothetical protein